jgi:hypothetical protein
MGVSAGVANGNVASVNPVASQSNSSLGAVVNHSPSTANVAAKGSSNSQVTAATSDALFVGPRIIGFHASVAANAQPVNPDQAPPPDYYLGGRGGGIVITSGSRDFKGAGFTGFPMG